MKFKEKVAFITGGGAGFGEAFAYRIFEEGAEGVALCDIDQPNAERVANEIRKLGGRAVSLVCDVSKEAQVEAAVSETVRVFGGIDIVINCAAKHLMEYSQPLTMMTRDKWRQMLDVNVTGIINTAAATRKTMKERGGGVILNISSISGFTSRDTYGVTKAAVRALTVALAHELSEDKTRVVGIAPGAMDTPNAVKELPPKLFDELVEKNQLIKRRGRVSDIVHAMGYLCSEDGNFITGETLLVAGGYPTRL